MPDDAAPDADAHAEIARLDADLDDLRDKVESCRRTIALARFVAALGPILVIAGWWRADPTLLVMGIAGALGGFVLAGSTRATREGLLGRIEDIDAQRTDLIDGLHWAGASARIVQSG